MKRRLGATFLRYLAVAIVLLLIAVFTRDQWGEFRKIENVSVDTFLVVSLLFIAQQFFAAWILRMLIAVFGVRLRWRTSLGLVCMRSLGNYLPLSAGLSANAVYLKLRLNFPFSRFAALMAGNLVLSVLTGGLLALGVLGWNYGSTGEFSPPLVGVLVAVVAVALIALVIPKLPLPREGRLWQFLAKVQEGWILLRSRKFLLLSIIALHVLIIVFSAAQHHFVFEDLQIDVAFAVLIVLAAATGILRLAAIFPGNLGVRESVAGGVMTSFGFPFSVGVLAAAVVRLVILFWTVLLGTIFTLLLVESHSNEVES